MGETFIPDNLLHLSRNSESLWHLRHTSPIAPYPQPHVTEALPQVTAAKKKVLSPSSCQWNFCFIFRGAGKGIKSKGIHRTSLTQGDGDQSCRRSH